MTGRRGWLLVGASLVLVVAVGVTLVEVFRLPSAERSDIVGFGGFALALAGVVVSVLGWLRRVGRGVEARSVSVVADSLAEGVFGQWRTAAGERGLLTPALIPVGWSWSPQPVTGTLTAALDGGFGPLPGTAVVTEGQLRAGGGRDELFAVYAGLASGRVVVVGPAGSGKSGSAVLLVLDALEHRERVGDTERARVPVPVLFTAHGWDPTTNSAGGWLSAQLVATYPVFQHRGGQAEAAAVVAAGAVTLILDGLDEMDQALRPAALRALNDAPFRVVVLTRDQEMVQASEAAWLTGAAALGLHEVTSPAGADYLEKACNGPPPSGWSQLLTELREHPDSVLSHGLSTPLMLNLVRDTYQTGDDVSELLTCPTTDHLKQHLIARAVPAAYTQRPGQPKPRYSLTQATQALTFIARQMNHDGSRDLAWWQIPRWAPTTPRLLISMLTTGLIGALLSALTVGLVDLLWGFVKGSVTGGLMGVLTDMLLGIALGWGIGLPFGAWSARGNRTPKLVKNWRAINTPLVLTTGLIYGLASGFAIILAFTTADYLIAELVTESSLAFLPILWLMWGLVIGFVVGPLSRLIEGEKRPHGRQKAWHDARVFGAGLGLAGFAADLMEPQHQFSIALLFGLWFGGAGALVGGFAGVFADGFTDRLVEGDKRPRSPRESWRDDQVFGLVFGLVVGLMVGLGWVLAGGVLLRGNWLFLGVEVALTLGLVCGITSSATWPTTVAWLLLRRSGVPAFGLMAFLEDARARGVLRTVGAVYQFRHAILQDHLAGNGHTTQSPTTFPRLRRVGRGVEARSVSVVADSLAEGVFGQWRTAAGERGLLTPALIPVGWSWSPQPVTGTLTAALDGGFGPLPGTAVVTEGQLRAGGGRDELFAVYAGLASGRVVVVGPAGSGKSGSAVLLVLDALEHRERVGDTERARVPVPVLFTAHGWDPTTNSAGGWLSAQLVATYPVFQHRGGQAEAAAVVAAGAVTLILDGLDEMDQALRPAALRALNDAPFRVVVLTRDQEMVQASEAAWLTGAAALGLHEVTSPAGADYLEKACNGPPPSGWSQLLTELREHPDSVLSHGLSTPLMLNLVRDTYQTGDDVSELLTCPTTDHLKQHLIARAVPAAYTQRPGQPKPRYSLTQATQALTFIARQMNHDGSRDLAWWQIPQWAPTTPRLLISMLTTGLIGALLSALTVGLLWVLIGLAAGGKHDTQGVSSPTWVATVQLLALGCGIGLPFGAWSARGNRTPKLVKNWRAINTPLVLTTGLIYGLAAGSVVWFADLLVAPLASFLARGLAFGLVTIRVGVFAKSEKSPQNPRARQLNDRVVVLTAGIAVGLIGFWFWFMGTDDTEPAIEGIAIYGFAVGLMYWSVRKFPARLAVSVVERAGYLQSPSESWRDDRSVGFIVGIVVGLATGLGYGTAWLLIGLFLLHERFATLQIANKFAVSLGAGIVIWLLCWITFPSTWPTRLSWRQLQYSRHVPAVRLMHFLEDARTRGILRTVGTVYQFRHATLQDHLAEQTTSSDAASSPTHQSV
jgi:RecA/RadA recombinase